MGFSNSLFSARCIFFQGGRWPFIVSSNPIFLVEGYLLLWFCGVGSIGFLFWFCVCVCGHYVVGVVLSWLLGESFNRMVKKRVPGSDGHGSCEASNVSSGCCVVLMLAAFSMWPVTACIRVCDSARCALLANRT